MSREEFCMMSREYLKRMYGSPAAFSECKPGDVIRYLEKGLEKSGTILWVCAPRDLGNRYIGITYIVTPQDSGQPVVVSPADVLMSEYARWLLRISVQLTIGFD